MRRMISITNRKYGKFRQRLPLLINSLKISKPLLMIKNGKTNKRNAILKRNSPIMTAIIAQNPVALSDRVLLTHLTNFVNY